MRRYGVVTAVLYDVFSGERPFYRPGRVAAIDALRLVPGDHVLVLGSGTGLDLPLIAARIGPSGTIVAVDDSLALLRWSSRRARDRLGLPRKDWPILRPVLADLTRVRTVLPPGEIPVDAVLAVNTLSLIPDRRRAWDVGLRAARPGARVAIADIGRPAPGHPLITAWSRWISFVGLGDLDARPWRLVEDRVEREQRWTSWSGHVQVRAGDLGW